MALYSWFVDTQNSNNKKLAPQKSTMWPIAKIQKSNMLLQRQLARTPYAKIKQLKVVKDKG